jgi:hypothetical protein
MLKKAIKENDTEYTKLNNSSNFVESKKKKVYE